MSKFIKFFIFFLILSCKSSTDSGIGEKTVYEPDAKKRAQAAAEKGGGLFGVIGGKAHEWLENRRRRVKHDHGNQLHVHRRPPAAVGRRDPLDVLP